MAAYRELIRNTGVRVDENGILLTEGVLVGLADQTGGEHEKLLNALSLMPARGDAHPSAAASPSNNLELLNIAGDVQPDGAFLFTLEWGIPRSEGDIGLLNTTGLVRLRAGLSQIEQTVTDGDGATMTVPYSGNLSNFFPERVPPVDSFGNAAWQNFNQSFTVTAEVQKPVFGFDITKRFTGSGAIGTASALAETYVGATNDASWVGPNRTYAVATILCTGAESEQQTENEVRATFSFEYRPETWRVEKFFRLMGRLPNNIDTGSPPNGYGLFDVYRTEDYSSLGMGV